MEWTVVTTLIALVGLFAMFIKPVVSLNTNIQQLKDSIDNLEESSKEHSARNSKAHDALFEKIRAHDIELQTHDKRISKLETK